MKKILFWALPALMLAACKQEQPTLYENAPGIYFFRNAYIEPGTQRDSLEFAFYVKRTLTGGTFNQELDIRTMGMPENHPRAFTLRQVNAGQPDAAVAGKHYVPFDDPRMIEAMKIPAGAVHYNVPIMCINDPELAEKKVRLEIEIVPNAEFGQGVEAYSKFVIWFGDIAVRPETWVDNRETQSWYRYFGYWSAVKMRYIAVNLGFSDFDLEMRGDEDQGIPAITTVRQHYYRRTMVQLLKAYNDAHPQDHMKDENGDEIAFRES